MKFKTGDKVILENHTLAGKVVTVHKEYPTYVEVLVQYEQGGIIYLESVSFNQVKASVSRLIDMLNELYV